MNIIYSTQSNSLDLFNDLDLEIKKNIKIEKSLFIVADSSNFYKWEQNNKDYLSNNIFIKEWELTSQRDLYVDMDELENFEKRLGLNAGVFGSIVADRRLFMGKFSSVSQDYSRRFTDQELLSILLASLRALDNYFKKYNPQILCGFICVTMLDYLVYLFAKENGSRVFNLRPTRIKDRVIFSNTLNDPDKRVLETYNSIINNQDNTEFHRSIDFINESRVSNSLYEGVTKPSKSTAIKSNLLNYFSYNKIKNAFRNLINYYRLQIYKDNHVINPFSYFFYSSLINPVRAKIVNRKFKKNYIYENDLQNGDKYIFFPLHTEPEVSLLVYGRPFVNQIELIRMIALNMPLGFNLYVKEHPMMLGKRKISAYNKILNIPRVKLVSPSITSRSIIESSSLLTVITGSMALEAAIVKKPVLTFGDCPYNILPNSMVKRIHDLRHINREIDNQINNYKYDNIAMQAYIESNYKCSVGVNLYSNLLKKKNTFQVQSSLYNDDIVKLSKYLLELLNDDKHSDYEEDDKIW